MLSANGYNLSQTERELKAIKGWEKISRAQLRRWSNEKPKSKPGPRSMRTLSRLFIAALY